MAGTLGWKDAASRMLTGQDGVIIYAIRLFVSQQNIAPKQIFQAPARPIAA